jgi:hypothetical protein
MMPFKRLVIYGNVRAQLHTHDGEEHAAFIPSCLHGATERGGQGCNRWVLELVETFCLYK